MWYFSQVDPLHWQYLGFDTSHQGTGWSHLLLEESSSFGILSGSGTLFLPIPACLYSTYSLPLHFVPWPFFVLFFPHSSRLHNDTYIFFWSNLHKRVSLSVLQEAKPFCTCLFLPFWRGSPKNSSAFCTEPCWCHCTYSSCCPSMGNEEARFWRAAFNYQCPPQVLSMLSEHTSQLSVHYLCSKQVSYCIKHDLSNAFGSCCLIEGGIRHLKIVKKLLNQ